MKIQKHKVALINYTLKDDDGDIIDTSEGGEPLAYIHGIGNLVPGLEAALEGKGVGEKLSVKVKPEEGYGVRDEELVSVVPRSQFSGVDNLEVGMQFHAQGDDGVETVVVSKVDGENVTIDANHPLAGMSLNFDIGIMEVRDATEEELTHGHVHGPGGHHH